MTSQLLKWTLRVQVEAVGISVGICFVRKMFYMQLKNWKRGLKIISKPWNSVWEVGVILRRVSRVLEHWPYYYHHSFKWTEQYIQFLCNIIKGQVCYSEIIFETNDWRREEKQSIPASLKWERKKIWKVNSIMYICGFVSLVTVKPDHKILSLRNEYFCLVSGSECEVGLSGFSFFGSSGFAGCQQTVRWLSGFGVVVALFESINPEILMDLR